MRDRLSRLLTYTKEPAHQVKFWAVWTAAWVALDPISIFTGLQQKIWWVSQMSDFANFASCATALVAAWSYLHSKAVNDAQMHAKLDHIIEYHPDIPPLS